MDNNVVFDTRMSLKYNSTYTKCKEQDIIFNISFSDYKKIHLRKTCFYTGVTLELNTINHPTIDRITPELGYVKHNLVVCSKIVNNLKGDLSINEIKALSLVTSDLLEAFNKLQIKEFNLGYLTMYEIELFKQIAQKIC